MPGSSLFSRIFATPTAASNFQTTVQGTGTAYVPPDPSFVPGLNASPTYGAPTVSPYSGSQTYAPPPGYAPPPAPGFPNSIYPSSTPTSLFPQGLFNGGTYTADTYSAFRLLQGPRLRHGYVSPGSKPDHLGINDTDVSVIFAFPNFLYSSQPIYVIPSFSLHLWDGPDGVTGADLPSSAYSGFIDFGWESAPNQMFSTEFGVRVGAFTDFDTFEDESIRVLGKALVNFQLTPTTTLKGGLYYLDRNDTKLVPALGVLCRPNPFTRLDLFFPQPKYSRFCRTIGTHDVWWYLAGDYGGGSWTIKRTDQTTDSIDINDFRAIAGIEWGTPQQFAGDQRTAFVEIGYVFEREVEYRFNPQDDYQPDDGFLLRAGIGY
jgi:hypothetical protein